MWVNHRVRERFKIMFINIFVHSSKDIRGSRTFCVNVIYMLMPFERLVDVNPKKFNISMLYALVLHYRLLGSFSLSPFFTCMRKEQNS